MFIYSTTKYLFTSAHRTYNEDLDQQENRDIFGKCSVEHGHNYSLEVTLKRIPIDRDDVFFDRTGIDDIIEKIVATFDYESLNLVSVFKKQNPTTENFAKLFWTLLTDTLLAEDILSNKISLYRVRVRETAKNFFDYYGENAVNPMII